MKLSEKVGNEPNFGGNPDHRLHTGVVFRIRHYREIRKVVINDINLLLILVRQMAALVRRALWRYALSQCF